MDYQLDGVKGQFDNMKKALKKNDQELLDYQNELKERENQIKLEEMRQALNETKKIAGAYKASTKKYVREDENGEIVMMTEDSEFDVSDDEALQEGYDVAEIIADN